jgi:integrase
MFNAVQGMRIPDLSDSGAYRLLTPTDRHGFVRLGNVADIPASRVRDLSHTHATLLLKEGTHAKIVSERLGHANIGITLDTYSHVLPGMQREAAESIDRALFSDTVSIRTG